MKHNQQICKEVEKGFSRYIQICLLRASRDFFRKVDQELYRNPPWDETTACIPLAYDANVSPTAYVEAQEDLLSAIRV